MNIARTIRVLSEIDAAPRGVTWQDLTRRAGIPRSTLFRLLKAAEHDLDVVIALESGRYRIVDWGILNPRGIRRAVRPRSGSPPA